VCVCVCVCVGVNVMWIRVVVHSVALVTH